MKSMNEMVVEALAEVAAVRKANPSFSREEAVSWASDGMDELFELNNQFSASLRQCVLAAVEAQDAAEFTKENVAAMLEPLPSEEARDDRDHEAQESLYDERYDEHDDLDLGPEPYEPSPYNGDDDDGGYAQENAYEDDLGFEERDFG